MVPALVLAPREDQCWYHRNPRLAPDKPADLARADEVHRKFASFTHEEPIPAASSAFAEAPRRRRCLKREGGAPFATAS